MMTTSTQPPTKKTALPQLNKISARITEPASQGASQAMLIATGMSLEDLKKPQIGIGAVWYDGNPCNMHLADLGTHVKTAAEKIGCIGMRFNTVGVSDGISMGTDGMSFSLQSRDLIADSIETIMGGQWYDALVAIPGCDKNMPATVMAMGRLNRPSLMLYGGTIRAGARRSAGRKKSSMSSLRFSLTGNHSREKSPKLNARKSSPNLVPAKVHAAACTPPTRWPLSLSAWD